MIHETIILSQKGFGLYDLEIKNEHGVRILIEENITMKRAIRVIEARDSRQSDSMR